MIKLTEIEEIGLTILALIRSGEFKTFKCSMCSQEMQEQRDHNMRGDSEIPVTHHPLLGDFYTCPIRFISESVYSFQKQYDYYEKYPASVPSYEDINARYWASLQFFENIKYELESEQLKKNSQNKNNNNSQDNKKAMTDLFK